MAIAEVSIVPLGTGSPSVSQHVVRAVQALDKLGVTYELTSMATILEGDIGTILDAVKTMHEAVMQQGVSRLVTSIRIDDRRDKPWTGLDKVESVKKKLAA